MDNLPDELYQEIYQWSDSGQIQTLTQCSTRFSNNQNLVFQNIHHRFGLEFNSINSGLLITRLLEHNVIVNINLAVIDEKNNIKPLGKIFITPFHTIRDLLLLVKNKTGRLEHIEYRLIAEKDGFTYTERYKGSSKIDINVEEIYGCETLSRNCVLFSLEENSPFYLHGVNHDVACQHVKTYLNIELKNIIAGGFHPNSEILIIPKEISSRVSAILTEVL